MQHGAAASRADDLHDPVQRADAITQPSQAARARSRRRAADTVVAHLYGALRLAGGYAHPGRAGAGVLDHVGECLGAEEINARLDRAREPAFGQLELNRHGEPGDEAGQSSGQAALGQDRGMDPRRDLTQLVEPPPGVAEGQAEQFPGPLRFRGQLLLGQLQAVLT